jgi:hypothetical protein
VSAGARTRSSRRPRRRCWSRARPQPDRSHRRGRTTIRQRPATQNAGPAENQHLRPGSCVQPSPQPEPGARGPMTSLFRQMARSAGTRGEFSHARGQPGRTTSEPRREGPAGATLTEASGSRTVAARRKPAAARQRQSSAWEERQSLSAWLTHKKPTIDRKHILGRQACLGALRGHHRRSHCIAGCPAPAGCSSGAD